MALLPCAPRINNMFRWLIVAVSCSNQIRRQALRQLIMWRANIPGRVLRCKPDYAAIEIKREVVAEPVSLPARN
jgi:hypothetical protein